MLKKLLFTILLLTTVANLAIAADISLSAGQYTRDGKHFIRVQNKGKKALNIAGIQYYFAGQTTKKTVALSIAPKTEQSIQLDIKRPPLEGDYNLCVTILYKNDKQIVSHIDNRIISFGEKTPINTGGSVKSPTLHKEGVISLKLDDPQWLPSIKLITPQELKVTSITTNKNAIEAKLINTLTGINSKYRVYWLIEKTIERNGKKLHAAGYFFSYLKTGYTVTIPNINIISFPIALTTLILFLVALFIPASTPKMDDRQKILSHSLFLLVVVNLLIVIFQIPGFLQGNNYSYFRKIGLTPLFFFYLFYALYSWISLKKYSGKELDNELNRRKTWLIFSYIHAKNIKNSNLDPNWSKKRKTAFLAVMVKFFYIPLLWSWTLHNIFRLPGVLEGFKLTLLTFNSMLVDIFILFDVAIFAFSYAVESRRLKTEIRSVEPTILGWIVCLLCYPPFNQFFGVFDKFFPIRWSPAVAGDDLLAIATVLITILWFVYLTATFSLGGKASNLTNRGIVTRFPYNLMRHPAYISKNLLWIIGFLFLGKSSLAIVLLGCAIYYLRAVTEENHLSMEPAYIKYKQKVKHRFIPGLF